jgi:hypothetical protein
LKKHTLSGKNKDVNDQLYTFHDSLKKSLNNPAFRKVWENDDAEFLNWKKRLDASLRKTLPHPLASNVLA